MSGGTKHDIGKPMMGLISGVFLVGLAKVLTFGARKYAAHNWRKGIALSRAYDALQRHMVAFWDGEDLDQESGLPHLDHAACELMFIRETWERRKDLDDRYKQEVLNGSAGSIPKEERPEQRPETIATITLPPGITLKGPNE